MSIGNITTAPPAALPDGPGREPARSHRGHLWVCYVIAVLIPVIGLVLAIQLAVMERYRDVRRHAIGVAATSIGVIVVWTVVAISLAGAHSDTNVASDLQTVLARQGHVLTSKPICAHQSGNSYTCRVRAVGASSAQLLQVTDDGHAVSWVPID